MIKLYFAPRTRSVRIAWLLEELELPYELIRREFTPPSTKFFTQETPTKKFPTIEDGDLILSESGAITEYIVERYGNGRLAPAIGSPERGPYLQWLHFAESTAFPPIGILVWLTRYRDDGADHEALIQDARARARSSFDHLESQIGDHPYIVGTEFTAADIMLGFTLVAAQLVKVLDDGFPNTLAYLERLMERPAFWKAAGL